MKEKKMVEIKNPQFVMMKNCRGAVKGVCPNDGTKMFKILPNDEIPAELKKKIESCKKNKTGGASRKSRKSSGSRKSRKSGGGKKSRKSRKSQTRK